MTFGVLLFIVSVLIERWRSRVQWCSDCVWGNRLLGAGGLFGRPASHSARWGAAPLQSVQRI